MVGKKGGLLKRRKGELRLLLGVASLGKQQLDVEVPKQSLNSFRQTWMVEKVRKTQSLLEVAAVGRQQLCLTAQETEGNLPSVEESDRWKSKGTHETIVVGGGQKLRNGR